MIARPDPALSMTSPTESENPSDNPGIPQKGHAYVLYIMFQYLMYQGFCNELPGGSGQATKKISGRAVVSSYKHTFFYRAYEYLGYGLHAVTDNISPVHKGFQLWTGDTTEHGPFVPFMHTKTKESTAWAGHGENEANAAAAMNKYLQLETCSCEKN